MFKIVNGVEVPLTEAEIADFNERERAHADALEAYELVKYKELRKAEYPTLEDMLVAMVEKEEGRPEALAELMAKRQQIKTKYPKPAKNS